MEKKLKFTYDINTIDHLGVKLYTMIPPMLAELVSNAWDADAHNVYISLVNGENKQISVQDDGEGMTFDELNEKFLRIGRNRREDLKCDHSSGGRPVLGKKGLGKLSMFGIGRKITIISVKNGYKNSFFMDYKEIHKRGSNGEYEPEMLCVDEPTDEPNGTCIKIDEISRKTDFDIDNIEKGIRARFKIFSPDFIVHIGDSIKIDDCAIPEDSYQFKWVFPDDYKGIDSDLYEFGVKKGVVGTIYTAKTPLKKAQQGIVLFSRNKLVQENKVFDKRGNDNFFLYMSGSFDVDFVDEDMYVDNCSTDRKSLAWDTYDNDELCTLNSLMEEIVSTTQSEWRKKRQVEKKKKLKTRGHDVDEWIASLNKSEQKLAGKLVNAIIDNEEISEQHADEYIEQIQEMYGFQSFRDFTEELSEMESLDNETAIKLLTDWELIESKEYAKIALGRIETINQFEKFVKADASETKVIQKFLEKFPWILDAKMASFDREVRYSKLLKENFPDEDLPEHDRRLDFLCSDNNGVVHIIELKRPSVKITEKQLSQIYDYVDFLEQHNPGNIEKIEGYLISNTMADDTKTKKMIKDAERGGIYVKSYSDLLTEARRYNKQYFDLYEEIKEKAKE